MKIALKFVLGLLAVYVVVMLGSGLAIRVLLSSSLGDRIREQVQQALPVEVSLSGGDFDLVEWMQFRPSLALDDLRIGNPDGFSNEPLLRADRVLARAGLFDLLSGETRVSAIQIDSPVVRVETNASGHTNIDALISAMDEGTPSSPDTAEAPANISIDSFLINNGRVLYSTPSQADFVAKNLDLSATGISAERAVDFTAGLQLFEEEAITIEFAGDAGPFGADSIPAAGHLDLSGALGRIPATFRRQLLGTVLEDPGGDSGAQISVDVEGDLLGVVTGAGTIGFENVRLGQDGVAQLPLDGEAQLLLTLIEPVANPAFHLIMPDASLSFGQGTWQGGIEAQYDGTSLSGNSVGRIEGVDINEMLTAFTDSPDVAFGNLTMPRYNIRFAGSDADQIFESLTGDGRLELADGSFAIFDTFQTIQGHAQKLISGTDAADGVTSFVEFVSNLEVRGQRVYTSGLALQSETLRMTGDGSFGFDQSLDMDLSSSVTGAVADLLGGTQDDAGVAWVSVPLRVRGSVDSPSVTPDFGRLVKDEAVRRATGILGTVLGGGSNDAEGDAAATEEQERPRLPFNLGDLLNKRSE